MTETRNPLDLSGRHILVTGASSGIGRETAILLGELNARLLLVARNRERLEQVLSRTPGERHRAEVFDLTSLDEMPSWLQRLAADAGPLDGLVHSAGVHSGAVPLQFLSAKRTDEVLRSNLGSALMLAKALRQKGCAGPGASIVFLASVSALAGAPGLAAYSASKAALLGLTRSLAVELAPAGLRVNCVAPGFVRTEMTERLKESFTAGQFARIEAMHPLGIGSPRDVACAIAFLLAETGRWITGSTLVVDGGYTAQ